MLDRILPQFNYFAFFPFSGFFVHKERVHSGTTSSKYQTKRKCVECNWSGPSGYKKHWFEAHPDVPLPFLCHICDYAAVLNYQLTDHIKNSHEKVKKEKDAKCDICNKLVSNYK